MRKAIYKNEIAYFLLFHKVSEDQEYEIKEALFSNPIDTTNQYTLKKDFSEIEDIRDRLKKIIKEATNKDRLIQDILSLFAITDDLELPELLQKQISEDGNRTLAVFTGSGVSKLLGLPLWEELANRAMQYLYDNNIITYAEFERLCADENSPKKKLTIFHQILSDSPKDSKRKAQEFYQEHLEVKNNSWNIYDKLVQMDCNKFSSNLDDEFWKALDRKNSKKMLPFGKEGKEEYSSHLSKHDKSSHFYEAFNDDMELISDAIYQIHGSIRNIEEYSIITMSDYIKYYCKGSDLNKFLNKVFNDCIVLFIGYGLEEFEILQHVFKNREPIHKYSSDEKYHHVLVGTYLNEPNLIRIRQRYFGELGINAHQYYLDFNGYNRLHSVVESWVKKITMVQRKDFYKRIGEFDGIEL